MQLVPISSFIQSSFWNKLAELKINVDRLDETNRPIWGYFSNVESAWPTHVLEVESTSFNSEFGGKGNALPFSGTIFNKNTIEQFKECDKSKLINEMGQKLIDGIISGTVLDNPYLLNSFFVLSFSDLKKFHFYYWFAFPVPHNLNLVLNDTISIAQHFSKEQLNLLLESYNSLNQFQKSHFLLHNKEVCTLRSAITKITPENLNEFYFAFADYKNANCCPMTQFKNYILLILHYCKFLNGMKVKFISLSLTRKLSIDDSVIFNITLPKFDSLEDIKDSWAGWEKNENGKFGPRMSNMKSTMDPKVLFEESVDLNLKLMKWRVLPTIDLEKIKGLKCLLLGAGTLGCSVARTLIGWGVRNITFVDNSTVSFSNPVRQSLFTYEDSLSNKPKAEAAAANLRKISPGMNSQAFQLTIPMPGHPIGEKMLPITKKDTETLIQLINSHDFVFLLTDSRESRWLPTLLGLTAQKTIINVALGFDSYLVMRYGACPNIETKETGQIPDGFRKISGLELGCYFCNDVTAPGNSLKDRTLDQQCTVTRPGVSAIAGALAVELAISLSQHEDGVAAPAYYKTGNSADLHADFEDQSILGILPHSIRGFLSSFTNVLPATPKYNLCIACSDIVRESYEKDGFEFLLQAFGSSKFLEDLTGLSQLLNESNFVDVLEISDDDDDWQD